MKKLLVTAVAIGLVAGLAATASATNGYFSHGYGIKNKGMAGAGVAAPMDAMAPANNPAGLTEVGNRFDLGLSVFNPNREYNVTGSGTPTPFTLFPGTVESDSNVFFIPNIGWSYQLNDNSAIGIAVYGNGGMNTDYPPNALTGFGTFGVPAAETGVDLMQLFIAPTYAIKFAEAHSFGITPIIAAQFFEARGLSSFSAMSSAPTKLSNNGHESSFGFGARIGYLGQLTDQFSIGLSWQSKIYMDELDDYAGLFAEQGDFDIPMNFTVGVAFMPIDTFTIAFDVQHIKYSDIDSVGNTVYSPGPLGSNTGLGFGWDDMTIYKLGFQWDRTEQWSYRFGYSYGEQPIPNSSVFPAENEVTFNILAPAVIEHHATFGLTYTFANDNEFDFSLMYAFEKDVTGYHNFDPAQLVTLTMNQWEVGLGYSWIF